MMNLRKLSEISSIGYPRFRKAMPLIIMLATFAIVFSGVAPFARAQTVYIFTPINYPGASSTDAHGINTQGQISGIYQATPPNTPPCETDAHSNTYCGHAFILTNGIYADIHASEPVNLLASINDNGRAAGDYAQYFFGRSNGFLYDSISSQFYPLPAAPGACSGFGFVNGVAQTATQAGGINNLGTIVGSYESCDGAVHAFILTGFPGSSPVFTVFDVPGSNSWSSDAWGINNGGQIVGTYNTNVGPPHGFLRDADGTFTNINFPPSQSPTGSVTATVVRSINDQGQTVGYYVDGSNVGHGFLLSNGVFSSLDFPLATQTNAYGINKAGTIVGAYTDALGNVHGFEARALAQTITSVTCNPSTVAVNQPTTCKANVTDTSETPTTPTGTVTFSTSPSNSGSFTPSNTCMLSPTATGPSNTCSVSYTPSLGTEGSQTITAAYGGDLTHQGSSGTTSLQVTQRTTSTSVSCSAAFLTDHHATPCTTTVTDTSPGAPITPSGTVVWRSSGKGTFSSNPCTLSGAGATATCIVTYTASPGKPLPQTITGTYSGDPDHVGSKGTTPITTP